MKQIRNAEGNWRVRLPNGEFELTLSELGAWIALGYVGPRSLVRPPVTRQWKLAANAVELRIPLAVVRRKRFNGLILYLVAALPLVEGLRALAAKAPVACVVFFAVAAMLVYQGHRMRK